MKTTLVMVAGLAVVSTMGLAAPLSAQTPAVATIDGTPITESELAERVQGRLQRLKNEEYALKRAALDELIVERVLKVEADRRRITVPVLIQKEVFDAVTTPTDVELRAVLESAPNLYGAMPEDRALAQARTLLVSQRTQRRRAEFIRDLKRTARVDVRLVPPRVPVDPGQSPLEGPANAAVTIVEFSDFECPYCAQLAGTMKRVRTAYTGRIRFAYRHLPLPMHPNAKKAAEVVTCAGEQDRFWFMHDKLFELQKRVQVGDWTAMAQESGLDLNQFKKCLDSPTVSRVWMADQKVAESLGITGTPVLFINGRILSGAASFDAIAEIIDEELGRPTVPSP